jgi:hypothetical protein
MKAYSLLLAVGMGIGMAGCGKVAPTSKANAQPCDFSKPSKAGEVCKDGNVQWLNAGPAEELVDNFHVRRLAGYAESNGMTWSIDVSSRSDGTVFNCACLGKYPLSNCQCESDLGLAVAEVIRRWPPPQKERKP